MITINDSPCIKVEEKHHLIMLVLKNVLNMSTPSLFVFRYLTAAHHGLTEAELLDLLSCDDDLLGTIYPESLPQLLRFPYHLWAAIKYDLGKSTIIQPPSPINLDSCLGPFSAQKFKYSGHYSIDQIR